MPAPQETATPLTCRQLINEGFVEIRFAHGIGELCGAKLSYSLDAGATYSRCAVFPGKGNDALLEFSSFGR